MTHSESTANIAAALAAAQGELTPVAFDRDNPFYHSRYATLTALREAMRPVFARHGLSVVQGAAENGGIETTILHSSGEWITSDGLRIVLRGLHRQPHHLRPALRTGRGGRAGRGRG